MPVPQPLRAAASVFRRFSEVIAVVLMAIIFVAFILQIVFRYALNLPVGWTSELSVAAWLWLVLWGAAFVLTEEEEIRFDLVTGAVGPRVRRVLTVVGAIALIGLFALSFPAAWSYVTFMKVERTSYMNIRFDWLFSIYLIFSAAVIGRYLWILGRELRGPRPGASTAESTAPTSAAK
jgi:TRAP-type C4-dicarboxylate transport system permease small subunit